eukprot:gene30711-35739_t
MEIETHWSISYLKITSFKSFGPSASEWSKWPCGLIGVVGANGAGKSCLLEAIAFACGGSSAQLRVKHLNELRHQSNAEDACAAEEFLRERSIHLDSAFIRQAQVAKLADSSTTDLAQVISNSSGLTRWEQETQAAMEELSKTRKALNEIHANVSQLQQRIKESNENFQQASRAQSLGVEINKSGRDALNVLLNVEHMAKDVVESYKAERTQLQDQLEECARAATSLKMRSKNLQNSAAGESSQRGLRATHGNTALALAKEVSGLEELVRQTKSKLKDAQALEVHWEKLHTHQQQLSASVQDQSKHLSSLHSSATQIRSTLDFGDVTDGCYVQQLKSMLQYAQTTQEEHQSESARLKELATNMRAQLSTSKVDHTRALEDQSTAFVAGNIARIGIPRLSKACQQAASAYSDITAKLSEAKMELDVAEQVMARQFKLPQMLRTNPGDPHGIDDSSTAPRPLHQCFNFNLSLPPNTDVEKYLQSAEPDQDFRDLLLQQKKACLACIKALSVMSGDKLNVVICGTASQASQLLDNISKHQGCANSKSGGVSAGSTNDRIRIWPLENLQSGGDRLGQQRRAQQDLGSGTL